MLIGAVVVKAIAREWLYRHIGCQFMGFILDTLASVRFLFMLVITLDRIFTVLSYGKYAGRVSFTLSAVVWIVSIIHGIVPLEGLLDCYTYVPTFSTATAVAGCSEECEVYIFTTLGITDFLGAVVPFFLYVILFRKTKALKKESCTCKWTRLSIQYFTTVTKQFGKKT